MLPTLFIDRDTWSHVLDAALRAAGIPFVAHRDIFRTDTPDAEWIAEVGLRGWVVVVALQGMARPTWAVPAGTAVSSRVR